MLSLHWLSLTKMHCAYLWGHGTKNVLLAWFANCAFKVWILHCHHLYLLRSLLLSWRILLNSIKSLARRFITSCTMRTKNIPQGRLLFNGHVKDKLSSFFSFFHNLIKSKIGNCWAEVHFKRFKLCIMLYYIPVWGKTNKSFYKLLCHIYVFYLVFE